jgi:hypothetical protein
MLGFAKRDLGYGPELGHCGGQTAAGQEEKGSVTNEKLSANKTRLSPTPFSRDNSAAPTEPGVPFLLVPFLWASKEKERGRAPPSAFKTTPPKDGSKATKGLRTGGDCEQGAATNASCLCVYSRYLATRPSIDID